MIKSSTIYRNTKNLNDDVSLMDVAMECAYFLEQLGALAFTNWDKGELVSGPYVDKFFSTITMMFPKDHSPDMTVLERLSQMNCKFSYEQETYRRVISYKENEDDRDYKTKAVDHHVLLLTIKIPNRYLALDGNTVYNIDGIDVNYEDIDVVYDDVSSQETESSDEDGGMGMGGFDDSNMSSDDDMEV